VLLEPRIQISRDLLSVRWGFRLTMPFELAGLCCGPGVTEGPCLDGFAIASRATPIM
jgi:hypothetical protein